MKRRALSALVCVWLGACGSHEAPPASSSVPPPSSVVAPPPSTSPPPSVGSVVDAGRPAPLTPEERARLAHAIHDGRHAAHAHDLSTALAQFETAATIAPGSSRVRCEAAFVAYEAGDLDRAEVHLRAALAVLPVDDVAEADRASTATCLYNAGLVYEARGRTDDARSVYTRSIALRPNATVQRHLDGLAPAGAREAPVLGPFTAATSDADIAAAVQRYVCAEDTAGMNAGEVPCDQYEPHVERTHVDGAVPIDAAIFSYDVEPPSLGEQLFSLLVVRAGDRVLAAELGQGYSPGVGGVSAELEAHAEARDVLPGGGPELIVTLHDELYDADMGTCDDYETIHDATIVCSTDAGALRCITLPTADVSMQHHEPCSDIYDDDGDGDYDEIPEGEHATSQVDGYALALRFEGGQAVFTRQAEEGGDEAPPLLGTQSLAALFAQSDRAWPDAWTEPDAE
jgi:tetratricopeptide (TPR) repeat protein